MSKINDDAYAISYKGTFDGTCTGPDGKAEKLPSPVRAASIYVRDGDKWKGAFHGETLIVDATAPPPPPSAKTDVKKEEPKKDDKATANSNAVAAPVKPVPGPNTDALVKMHTAGWEAFKTKDARWFNDNLSSNFALVNALGVYFGSKADVVKQWTETMKCEGITKVALKNGFASAISPTVEILTVTGNADGKCDGQPNGDLWHTAVYAKEGEAWKLAYMFESPAM
jgi:hypothetical protein